MNSLYLGFIIVTLAQPCKVSADSQTTGTVQLYSDDSCSQASGSNISLAVNSCLETNQSAAIAALSFPPCSNDVQPILYISDRIQCDKASIWPSVSSGNIVKCLSLATGAGIGSAAFVCVESVTTVSASPTAHATSQADTAPSSKATTGASSSTHAPESSVRPGAQDPTQSGDGLTQSDKVTIAVGVSIGIAALAVAIAGAWYTRLSAVFQLMPQRVRWMASSGVSDAPPPYREFELYREGGG